MQSSTIILICVNVFLLLLLLACLSTHKTETGGVLSKIINWFKKPSLPKHIPGLRTVENALDSLNDRLTVPQIRKESLPPPEVLDNFYKSEYDHPALDGRDRPVTSFSSELINDQFRTPMNNVKLVGCGLKGPSRNTEREQAF